MFPALLFAGFIAVLAAFYLRGRAFMRNSRSAPALIVAPALVGDFGLPDASFDTAPHCGDAGHCVDSGHGDGGH